MTKAPEVTESLSENQRISRRLMPWARRMIVALTAFFLVASLSQLVYLHLRIENAPSLNLKETIHKRINTLESDSNADFVSLVQFESLALLEEHALNRRYHQANVLLMSRIWISYLSFVTGMILCLVGASFILARIQEPVTKLDADSKVAKFTIASTSPGLILAMLGTFLIITSIVTHHRITVEDRSVYIAGGLQTELADVVPESHQEEVDSTNEGQQDLDDAFE